MVQGAQGTVCFDPLARLCLHNLGGAFRGRLLTLMASSWSLGFLLGASRKSVDEEGRSGRNILARLCLCSQKGFTWSLRVPSQASSLDSVSSDTEYGRKNLERDHIFVVRVFFPSLRGFR